jgi:hypothetical protein
MISLISTGGLYVRHSHPQRAGGTQTPDRRTRAHKRSLSREIEALLQRALAQTKPVESRDLEGGLGTELARLFPKELRSEDFIPPSRDDPERPPPTFD